MGQKYEDSDEWWHFSLYLCMDSPTAIFAIAEWRLAEADALRRANLYEGAIYLAGYGVELILKAKICQRLNIPNLFDDGFVRSAGRQVMGIDFRVGAEFRKFYLVHDIAKLLLLTGLQDRFLADREADTSGQLTKARTDIVEAKWSEELRYLAAGTKTKDESLAFLEAVNQFRAWILTV